MALSKNQNYNIFQERRKELIKLVKQKHRDSEGKIVLFANFEREGYDFRQDSTFFYFTGLHEPAAVLCIDLEAEESILFIPNFGNERKKWVADSLDLNTQTAHELKVEAIEYLGQQCLGYQCHPFFTHREYEHFLNFLQTILAEDQNIYTLNPVNASEYIEQRFVLQRIAEMLPSLKHAIIDITPLAAQMRRKKDKHEIEQIYKAIEITVDAHDAIMQLMQAGKKENELQALIEYHYTLSGATRAFSSIVASGKNSTILHYFDNQKTLVSGDLVVVDIGARYNSYCADLTRTYPVGGAFSQRQKEVYQLVLETQSYIAQLAKPGMWLSNKNEPEQSLNHCARKFVEDHGYGDYYIHGIGHFLGLDVHDVGDHSEPLQAGDIITIEPGIYIPEESLGIRIEDDYWIVSDGVICLSESLPKEINDIEKAVAAALQEDDK
jgi:Xaa-Pro aminopeptidase